MDSAAPAAGGRLYQKSPQDGALAKIPAKSRTATGARPQPPLATTLKTLKLCGKSKVS
jgi:hypothetical protein